MCSRGRRSEAAGMTVESSHRSSIRRLRSLAARARPCSALAPARSTRAIAALYALYESVRGFGSTSLALPRRTPPRSSPSSGRRIFIERPVQSAARICRSAAAPRLPLYEPASDGHRWHPGVGLSPPSGSLPGRPHDARRRDRGLARDLRPLSGRTAAPLRARLRRHGDAARAPQPQLRSPRQPLQSVRGRPEPALRLCAPRRRRDLRARPPPLDAPAGAPTRH